MVKKRILVISSANIDFVQRMRRVPYSGETVTEMDNGYSYVPGGKGANSAIAFSRLGADCVFACKLGRDANGKRLSAIYAKEGIDTRYIWEDDEHPTGLASILVEENGKNRIIVYPGANNYITPADIEEPFTCYPDAVYMQLEIPFDAVVEATKRANESSIPVFIDAGPASVDYDLSRLGKVEIFSPNESETRVFTGITPNSEENLPARGDQALDACGRELHRSEARRPRRVPVRRQAVLDVPGGGYPGGGYDGGRRRIHGGADILVSGKGQHPQGGGFRGLCGGGIGIACGRVHVRADVIRGDRVRKGARESEGWRGSR